MMIEFMFQYFESIGISRNTVFTVLTSILIFGIGFIANGVIKALEQFRRRRRIRKLVCVYLQSTIPQIERQCEYLLALSKQLTDKKHADVVYKESVIRSDFLRTVPQIDLFNSLVYGYGEHSKKRIAMYNKMSDAMDRIERNRVAARSANEQYDIDYNRYFSKFNDSIGEMQRAYDLFRSHAERNNIKPSADPFLSEFDDVASKYGTSKTLNDPDYLIATYVVPVKEIAIKYYTDPRAVGLIHLANTAKISNENRDILMMTLSLYYAEVVQALTGAEKDLKEALDCWS